MIGDLVRIEWLDILSCDDWETWDVAVNTEPAVCYIVGWLAHDDPRKVVIVHCKSDKDVHGYHVIPKACVVKTTRLSDA